MKVRPCPGCGTVPDVVTLRGPFPLARCDTKGCPIVWFSLASSRVVVSAVDCEGMKTPDVGAGGPTPLSSGDQGAEGRPWELEARALLQHIRDALDGWALDENPNRKNTTETWMDLLARLRNLRANASAAERRWGTATPKATADDPPAGGLGNPPPVIGSYWTCRDCGCHETFYKGHLRCPRCGSYEKDIHRGPVNV